MTGPLTTYKFCRLWQGDDRFASPLHAGKILGNLSIPDPEDVDMW